jgi:hypothetical protein
VFYIWAIGGFSGTSSKTYSSDIPGMSDFRYTQCVRLGSEVIELQASNAQRYYAKQEEWDRSCGSKELNRILEGNPLKYFPGEISPLEWARRGK